MCSSFMTPPPLEDDLRSIPRRMAVGAGNECSSGCTRVGTAATVIDIILLHAAGGVDVYAAVQVTNCACSSILALAIVAWMARRGGMLLKLEEETPNHFENRNAMLAAHNWLATVQEKWQHRDMH